MLTQRQHEVLNYLLMQNSTISIENLSRYFKVSQKTMRNEIHALIDISKIHSLSIQVKPSQGIMVHDKHNLGWTKMLSSISYVEPKTRQWLILLEASLNHKISVQACATSLSVSRQTLTRDLKKIHTSFELSEEQLIQTTHGFHLNLDEVLLRHKLTHVWLIPHTIKITYEYLNKKNNLLMQTIQTWISEFEDCYKVKLEKQSHMYISNLIALLSYRSTLHPLNSDATSFITILWTMPLDQDAIFRIECALLAARYNEGSLVVKRNQDELAHELLSDICNALNISLQEDNPHIQNLFMHLKATLLRIKHQSWIDNPMIEDVRVSLSLIYDMIQQCLVAFESRHNLSFNDHEISFIVMHCGVLIQSLGIVDSQLKVAIVCPHGIATSQLLLNRIQSILPHHYIYGPYSINEFNAMSSHTVFDTVITTVSLQINNEIVVHPILSVNDQEKIEKTVWNATYQKQCERILNTYLVNQQDVLTMSMMIQPHHLQLSTDLMSWKQAIQHASLPLLQDGRIKSSYIEKMIWAVDTLGPYMVILPQIAFVHAAPDDGVLHNGISCLRLKDPITFGDKKGVDVKVIFVIASKAKEDMGLVKLIRICEHEHNRKTLLYSNSKKDILLMKG